MFSAQPQPPMAKFDQSTSSSFNGNSIQEMYASQYAMPNVQQKFINQPPLPVNFEHRQYTDFMAHNHLQQDELYQRRQLQSQPYISDLDLRYSQYRPPTHYQNSNQIIGSVGTLLDKPQPAQ